MNRNEAMSLFETLKKNRTTLTFGRREFTISLFCREDEDGRATYEFSPVAATLCPRSTALRTPVSMSGA